MFNRVQVLFNKQKTEQLTQMQIEQLLYEIRQQKERSSKYIKVQSLEDYNA